MPTGNEPQSDILSITESENQTVRDDDFKVVYQPQYQSSCWCAVFGIEYLRSGILQVCYKIVQFYFPIYFFYLIISDWICKI